MSSFYTKEEILDTCKSMFNDIDECITNLVKARLNNDEKKERRTLNEMESLMCGIQQDLTVVIDYISSEEYEKG